MECDWLRCAASEGRESGCQSVCVSLLHLHVEAAAASCGRRGNRPPEKWSVLLHTVSSSDDADRTPCVSKSRDSSLGKHQHPFLSRSISFSVGVFVGSGIANMLRSLRTARAPAPYSRLARHSLRRTYASVTDLSSLPKPGTELHGFRLERVKNVHELELSALHFKHAATGADYLHIARDDSNNAFSIGFKTNPPDSTGVPHILEHVTLCGSEKYPVRDPFMKMLPRSLQNFMNAFTSSDYTMYPFATTNKQDYRNLLGVYLDATLHPFLKKSDFVQEGWRLGPENPLAPKAEGEGKTDDIVFKGVVYNEMKGMMSDTSYLYYIRFMEQIIPALNNSGGDPSKMTDLTWEQLKGFHQAHYHPSNSKIMTYGDSPVEEHLQYLGEQLSRFGKVVVDQDIKVPINLEGGKNVVVKGPVDPLTPVDAQYKTSTTWLMGESTDIKESFALRIATSILMDGYGSPLYRALIESGLGSDYSANTGYDTSGANGVFSVGLNGVTQENVPKVKEAITSTLREVIDRGLDKHKVDGILHQLELGLKHKSASFGLSMLTRLKPSWFNGVDPFDSLAWNSTVEHFKAEYAKPRYLEGLLEKYLLNDNTLTFTMEPSPAYATDAAAEEAERLQGKILEAVKQFPSEEEAHKHLRERELELLEEQEAGRTEDLDVLPTLRVNDIERQQKHTDVRDSTIDNGVKVQWRETPTNGLTYFRALSLFKDLPDELRLLLPLFCDSLQRIGTKSKTMGELEDLIKLKTGGISFGYHATPSPFDIQRAEEGLSLSGYALDRNVPAMYELLQTLLLETDFDSPHAYRMIKQLLQTGASGAVDSIAESGHAYARRFAEAGLTPNGRLLEQTAGITQVKLITSLASAEENPTAMADLVSKLKSIQALAVGNMKADSMRAALTCSPEEASANERALQSFLESASSANLTPPSLANHSAQTSFPTAPSKTFFNLPYQVSYVGLALPTTPYTDPSSAPLAVLSQLLTHKHLHHEIREKGGAYGGGAYSRGLGGVFGMYSYRDPNPLNTIKTMQDAGRFAAERQWTERELEEAKLSLFQAIDAPISASKEGMTRFVSGVDADMEQRRREWLLDVGVGQVREAAEGLVGDLAGKANLVVLGERKGWVKEAEGWRIEDVGMAK